MATETYDNPSSITKPKSLKDLIARLQRIFALDRVNVDYVQKLMSSYDSKESEWELYSKFDPHCYTRNLVDEGNGKFNLLVLCWGEGMGSSIHSHSNSHCFMKILDGVLKEEQYEWPENDSPETPMTLRECNTYKKNECAYISDEVGLHRVENPSHTEGAVSLHLYSPPFDTCLSFDQRTGHRKTVPITFWSKYGKTVADGKSAVN